MPDCFKESYLQLFSIIDATELKGEVLLSLPLQSLLYSCYKSHTTTKGLVATAPNGCFTFIRDLFTSSISDRELVCRSGFLDLLELVPPGKSIMADRGFDIQDLLAQYNVLLNIPAF